MRITALVVAGFAALSASGLGLESAIAQGNSTNVGLNVRPGLSMSCDDVVEIEFTAQQIAEMLTGNSSADQGIPLPSTSTSVSGSGSSWDVTITGLDTSVQAGRLTQQVLDVCSVRAVALRRNSYTVSVALTGNTWLDGPGGSRVRVTDVRLRLADSNSAFAEQVVIDWFTLQFRLRGRFRLDVEIEFDFQQAIRPGLHSSATPGTFQVTVSQP